MLSSVAWKIKCRQFAKSLKKDDIFAYPSESVFALGCFVCNSIALKKLDCFKRHSLKKRSGFIVLFEAKEKKHLSHYWDLSKLELLDKGLNQRGLTLVGPVDKTEKYCKKLSFINNIKNLKSLAFRLVDDSVLKPLLSNLQKPITSTSLNPPNKKPTQNVTKARVYCRYRGGQLKILINSSFSCSDVSRIYDIQSQCWLR